MNSNNPLSKKNEEALSQLSPFEIKNELIELAKADARKSNSAFLNAGRGNPNWIATDAREAFFLLGSFALAECRRVYTDEPGIAGIPAKDGSADRFEKFLADNATAPGADLLTKAYRYMVETLGADRDELAYEWAEGIIGDQYPTPPRILKYTEAAIRPYLAQEMGNRAAGGGKEYDLFATEGGTAAMCYVFDSLQANHLVKRGDKIALMAPLFTPYIEIPELDRFNFDVVTVSANEVEKDGYHHWQYPESELDKLRDPSIRLLCLINPSNPPSYRLSDDNMKTLVDIVRKDNPNLIIVTDDVYGTFAKDFKSLMYVLPYNTLCVYSFSKYFGATGWRLAVVAAAQDNVCDHLIATLPDAEKEDLRKRYESLTLDVPHLKFIDRMVADSRDVALNHTAGLSTPQQIQMSLFALKCLLDTEDVYKGKMQQMIHDRLDTLWENTGFKQFDDDLRVGYYSEIDFMVQATKVYGEDFAKWLAATHNSLDVTIRLAKETATVVLNGSGFDGPEWSIRTSEANLDKDAYAVIGKKIRQILDEYYAEYQASKK
ncbi:MAG: bifunctional aspartate transaminase/aspartate 4-decarboxylase [Muribaculaceae bacterium]|nr:bifunctional aspartate transaminase/aspartate 4-decarboxylase [Muribaculaceae bacterium]